MYTRYKLNFICSVVQQMGDPKDGYFLKALYYIRKFYHDQFSEILNLMNKLQLPFSYFTLYPDLI